MTSKQKVDLIVRGRIVTMDGARRVIESGAVAARRQFRRRPALLIIRTGS